MSILTAFRKLVPVVALSLCAITTVADVCIRFLITQRDSGVPGQLLRGLSFVDDEGNLVKGDGKCIALRFVSNACSASIANSGSWLKLQSAMVKRGCEVVELSNGPHDARIGTSRASFHKVVALSLPSAERLKFARIPTTIVINKAGVVVWSYTGVIPMEEADTAISRVDEPTWRVYLRPMEISYSARPTKTAARPYLETQVASVRRGALVRGSLTATIQIVEFGDFQCPFCSSASRELAALVDHSHGVVGLSSRQFPLTFHEHATDAAAASLAALRQGRFEEMHDRLYLQPMHLGRNEILAHATALNLDVTRFSADMASGDVKSEITADIQDGERLGVEGTPTLFVNGRKYNGPVTEWALQSVIVPLLGISN